MAQELTAAHTIDESLLARRLMSADRLRHRIRVLQNTTLAKILEMLAGVAPMIEAQRRMRVAENRIFAEKAAAPRRGLYPAVHGGAMSLGQRASPAKAGSR